MFQLKPGEAEIKASAVDTLHVPLLFEFYMLESLQIKSDAMGCWALYTLSAMVVSSTDAEYFLKHIIGRTPCFSYILLPHGLGT